MVDVYAKIEAEHLLYLWRNQGRLRVKQYVHLRDALIGTKEERKKCYLTP